MRGVIENLPSPHPLGATLPGLYQADRFSQQLCQALDEVLAPILATLDNLPAYLDLDTAPDDLLPWLARWVGMSMDAELPGARQRELLRAAASLQGWQGTARGVQLALEGILGGTVEVTESGGAAWAMDPAAPLPGEPTPMVTVQVQGQQTFDEEMIRALVAEVIPAHVVSRVTVI